MLTRALIAVAISAAPLGCSSIGGSAVRTGPLNLPPRSGPIAIYATSVPHGTEVGAVEVHAASTEANVETLLPLFVRKVAALGGNAAVIDRIVPRFEMVPRPYTETFSYACGWRAVCVGTRTYWITEEVPTLQLRGRAFLEAAR